jgi:hypothetical protein
MSRTRHKQQKAKGGKVEQEFYNAEGSAAHHEAEQEDESFKRGGTIRKPKAKRKRGGAARQGLRRQGLKADGKRARPRADKPRRARGGEAGHSPLTKASETEGRPGSDCDGKPSTREDD